MTNATHVYPLNDEHEHVLNGDLCPCLPRERDGVLIHNSYDGREVGEVCAKALDLLALALIECHRVLNMSNTPGVLHEWSADARDAYEHAIQLINMHYEIEANS